MIKIILGFIILALIIVSVLLATGVINTSPNDDSNKNYSVNLIPPKIKPLLRKNKDKNKDKNNFINPSDFNTGYIKDSPQVPSDVCRNRGGSLYPVNLPYENDNCCYLGNCDIISFNSSP